MNKTKIDNMLIDNMLLDMITPKVREIEEKFARGEGLEQADIHTLLLKSQYNHINHLDQKLDEIAQSNANLEHKFEESNAKLRLDVEQRIGSLEVSFANLKTDIQQSINDIMKWYIGGAGIILIILKALDIFIK